MRHEQFVDPFTKLRVAIAGAIQHGLTLDLVLEFKRGFKNLLLGRIHNSMFLLIMRRHLPNPAINKHLFKDVS